MISTAPLKVADLAAELSLARAQYQSSCAFADEAHELLLSTPARLPAHATRLADYRRCFETKLECHALLLALQAKARGLAR